MPNFEPSEREIIIRISNDQDYWDVYVTEGATGGAKLIRAMTVEHQDENGTRGRLPRKAISIRNVHEDGGARKKRDLTDEQRAAIAERFRKAREARSTVYVEIADQRPEWVGSGKE